MNIFGAAQEELWALFEHMKLAAKTLALMRLFDAVQEELRAKVPCDLNIFFLYLQPLP